MRPIVLASTSPYRRTLLERLRLDFETAAPDCDETRDPGETAGALVGRLAEDKARSVGERHPQALIIGSDQVAALDERILTKPGTHARAVEQLTACSGRSVIFHTGLCLFDAAANRAHTERIDYMVHYRDLNADEIERYLQREQPYDCAGSIRSEGYAVTLFESMEGPDPTALIGLPLIRLAALLREAGVELP